MQYNKPPNLLVVAEEKIQTTKLEKQSTFVPVYKTKQF